MKFSDHYKYESKDIKKIIKTYQKSNDLILTTEKDAQKLKEFNELKNLPVYYLKVTIDFLWNKDKFDKKIKDYVDLIQTTSNFLKDRTDFSPEIGIILGTGLGGLWMK